MYPLRSIACASLRTKCQQKGECCWLDGSAPRRENSENVAMLVGGHGQPGPVEETADVRSLPLGLDCIFRRLCCSWSLRGPRIGTGRHFAVLHERGSSGANGRERICVWGGGPRCDNVRGRVQWTCTAALLHALALHGRAVCRSWGGAKVDVSPRSLSIQGPSILALLQPIDTHLPLQVLVQWCK